MVCVAETTYLNIQEIAPFPLSTQNSLENGILGNNGTHYCTIPWLQLVIVLPGNSVLCTTEYTLFQVLHSLRITKYLWHTIVSKFIR